MIGYELVSKSSSSKILTSRQQIKQHFPDGIAKLEIGSGADPAPGYVHLDIQSGLPQLDILADVRKMPLPANFVSQEIRAVHIMEHFCHPEYSGPKLRKKYGTIPEVLKECYRILKPGGKLRIVTPDFEKISVSAAHRRVDFDWLQRWTAGGHQNDYDIHHWLWTTADAHQWFTQVGFKNLRDWNPVKPIFPHWQLDWQTPDTQGNQDWHKIEWYHWLFFEGQK